MPPLRLPCRSLMIYLSAVRNAVETQDETAKFLFPRAFEDRLTPLQAEIEAVLRMPPPSSDSVAPVRPLWPVLLFRAPLLSAEARLHIMFLLPF
jgi:hypothetical protein